MSNIYQPPFAPKSLKDFAFNNPASKLTIEGIVNGAVPFPANKCAICLYGAHGSGKTTLAKLLPTLLEASGNLPTFPRCYSFFAAYNWVNFRPCNILCGDKTFLKQLASDVFSPMLGGPSGWHYEILDEVDNLSPTAQASLKGLIDPAHGTIFIMTTNHPERMDKGLINRSHMIEMNYPSPQQYQNLGTNWLIQSGFTGNEVSQAQWSKIIAGCKGFRDLGDAVATVINTLRGLPPPAVI